MAKAAADEERDGVGLTNLDKPLFDGSPDLKRALVDYLDAMSDRLVPHLAGRPLSVIRILRGDSGAFMQKNVPKYTPDFVRTVSYWAERSKRDVTYALCDDRRTLLWFANQRAVEYHVALFRAGQDGDAPTHLVLDIDPPEGSDFGVVVRAARLVQQALADSGLAGTREDERREGRAHLRPDRPHRATNRSPRRPAPSPPAPSDSTRTWRRPRSSSRSGTARSSSTRHAPAAQRSCRSTARGCGTGCPSRSPSTGPSSTT